MGHYSLPLLFLDFTLVQHRSVLRAPLGDCFVRRRPEGEDVLLQREGVDELRVSGWRSASLPGQRVDLRARTKWEVGRGELA